MIPFQEDSTENRRLADSSREHQARQLQNIAFSAQSQEQFPSNRLGDMAAKWSWRCFFGIHQWAKWSTERTMFSLVGGGKTMGQDRHCTNCNKIEPPNMTLACRFNWHNWARWSHWYPVENTETQRLYIVQMRTCDDCGKTQSRHTEHPR